MASPQPEPSSTLLLNKAADAIEETLWWHSVGLSLGGNQGIGSGAAVSWKGRSLVITVRHNFRTPGLPDVNLQDLGFLLRNVENIERVSVEEAMARRPLPIEGRQMLGFHSVLLSRREDLAAVRIDESDPGWQRARFFPLTPDLCCPSEGTVCIHGYPAGTSVHLGGGLMVVFPRVEWTSIEPQPPDYQYIQGYDPNKNFLVEWISARQPLHPGGMSGGLFWRKLVTQPDCIWTSTDILPIGICQEYVKDRHCLKGLKIEAVIEFLDSIDSDDVEVLHP